NHAASAGAFHPDDVFPASNLIFAPNGGFFSNAFFNASDAFSGSHVGGKRIDNEKESDGNVTLPAFSGLGNPSAPITDNAGRHVRFKISSAKFIVTGFTPLIKG